MKKNEKGFAVLVALLFTSIASAAAATAFFISVADLKVAFNRSESARSLRDAERVLARAEMEMADCLKEQGVDWCLPEVEDSVIGITEATPLPPDGFLFVATGETGNFATAIEALYSAHNGAATMETWHYRELEN